MRSGSFVILEGPAAPRGSVLGEVPALMQASQKAFETRLRLLGQHCELVYARSMERQWSHRDSVRRIETDGLLPANVEALAASLACLR